MTGWIKLHRKLLSWEWYNDINTTRLFIHLLLKANREVKEWRGISILPGQFITGRKILANELNMSIRQIRTSLTHLKTTSEIAIKTTNRFCVITICRWDEYQGNDNYKRPAKRPTKKDTTDHKQEENNIKNTISVKFDEFRKSYPGTKRGLDIELNNFLKNNSPETVEKLLPALHYEITYKNQLTEIGEFCPVWKNLSTWINQKCWEQEFPPVKQANKHLLKGLEPPKGLKR